MKYFKIFRILAVALMLALLAATMPATPALAQAYLYVYPTRGEIGDTFELYGYDFATNYVYDMYFSGEIASVGEDIDDDVLNYEFLGEITTDLNGEFVEFFFDVPAELTDGDADERVRGGTYYIYATYANQEDIKARVTFTVEVVALITLDPDDGIVGTEVTVTGEGFGDREDLTVEYGGSSVDIESGDEDTDSAGDFELTILVPESVAGEHTITVIGDESDIEVEAEFTVEEKITITPESGASGSAITIEGTGFGDEVDVTITFDGDEVAEETTDDDGSFTVDFNAPSMAAGSYDVEAEDEDGNSDQVTFDIAAAAISLSSITGYVGEEVTVSGTGFQASKPSISITFDNELVKTAASDAFGAFTASFVVPVRNAGAYQVEVSDGTNTVEADFSISTSASVSPQTSAASPGSVGVELTVNGVGFSAGRTVTVTYDDSQVATATVNTNGTFSVTFKAPVSSGGEHIVIATDAIITTQFSFFMESTPPSTVYPQLPLMDSKLEDWSFDWCGDATDLSKEVTDTSLPVTYTLLIATDESFSEDSTVFTKAGITQSEYTLTGEERLEAGGEEAPYYWKVKAVDAASNERWSGVGSFYVSGFALKLSQPVIYTLIGVGGLLLFVIGIWLGRRTAYY